MNKVGFWYLSETVKTITIACIRVAFEPLPVSCPSIQVTSDPANAQSMGFTKDSLHCM